MTNININEYFDFFGPDDIRVKGTRVGIETILDEYLDAMSPEEISVRYPSLSLEQVYATITFYLHNQQEMNCYLKRWREYAEDAWQQQQNDPSAAVERLRQIKRQRHLRKRAA